MANEEVISQPFPQAAKVLEHFLCPYQAGFHLQRVRAEIHNIEDNFCMLETFENKIVAKD